MVRYHAQIKTIDSTVTVGVDGAPPFITQIVETTHVFNSNLQKQLLSEYDQKSKIKSQEWAKLISDKKSLITIIFGQCNDATRTKIAHGTTYEAECDNRNLINFLTRLRTICYKSDDGGLSYKPYKLVVAVKSLHNFSNLKPDDPHAFKEELKIKFGAILKMLGSSKTEQQYWNIYSKQRLLHKIGVTIVRCRPLTNLSEKRKQTL